MNESANPAWLALQARSRELLTVHCGEWLPTSHTPPETPEVFWDRGFVCRVECSAAWWLAHGDDLYAREPVTAVAPTTRFRWVIRKGEVELGAGGAAYVWHGKAPPGALTLSADEYEPILLAAIWPGVAFTLPESGIDRRGRPIFTGGVGVPPAHLVSDPQGLVPGDYVRRTPTGRWVRCLPHEAQAVIARQIVPDIQAWALPLTDR